MQIYREKINFPIYAYITLLPKESYCPYVTQYIFMIPFLPNDIYIYIYNFCLRGGGDFNYIRLS